MPNTTPPPTRLISWQQVVTEADPNYWAQKNRPWIYEMSNGRRFYASQPTYPDWTGYWRTEDGGFVDSGYPDNGGLIPLEG